MGPGRASLHQFNPIRADGVSGAPFLLDGTHVGAGAWIDASVLCFRLGLSPSVLHVLPHDHSRSAVTMGDLAAAGA